MQLARSRGLTPAKVVQVRGWLKEAEEASPRNSAPSVSADELAAARAAQMEALDDLRDYWNDVATMLRPAFGAAAQLVLGLSAPRPRGKDEETTEPEEKDAGAARSGGPKNGSSARPGPVVNAPNPL